MNEISEIRRIGGLTSGGDFAGLNVAICAVVYRASFGYGWDVVEIENRTLGLLSRPRGVRRRTKMANTAVWGMPWPKFFPENLNRRYA